MKRQYTDITKNAELYLDYWTNFITVSAFADYYGFDIKKANEIIRIGKIEYNLYVEKNKKNLIIGV
tara:strand:+ start:73 stop:270 length:198 start_codon:yes stop_codon:yes gene_type:complete